VVEVCRGQILEKGLKWRKFRAKAEQVPKRCLMDSFLAPHNGQGSFFQPIGSKELPKKSSDHGSEGTFLPEL